MFCLRKLLSLLAEKRLNRRREETCMKPVRASFRTGKSPFSTPEEPLPDSKQGSSRLQTRLLPTLNMALTPPKYGIYIPMSSKLHPDVVRIPSTDGLVVKLSPRLQQAAMKSSSLFTAMPFTAPAKREVPGFLATTFTSCKDSSLKMES